MDTRVIIDIVVLAGVAVVLPLALGHTARWMIAAGAVAVSILLPVGPVAAVAAMGWTLLSAATLLPELRAIATPQLRPPRTDEVVRIGATTFALVASVAFAASRGGVVLFGIGEPIVELTAVHFTYAGVGASVLAGAAFEHAGARTAGLGHLAIALTLLAPPVVALGFVVGHPVPQIGGALLMSAGVLLTASLQLAQTVTSDDTLRPRVLLALSGLAPWLPMVLAVAWATANYFDVPALAVPDMVRTHGMGQTFFVLAGLVARRLSGRQPVGAWDGTAHPTAEVTS